MRTYIPIKNIEARDPAWAERIRCRERRKQQRQRASNPERERIRGRAKYAKDPERYCARKKAWRMENQPKVRAIKDKYWSTNRAKYILQHVRTQAKAKGVEFDLTLEWMQARLKAGVCEMSGLPFDLENKRSPNSPSIDRKVPGSHYTQANCRMILWSINRALNNWGEDYFVHVVGHILSRRNAEG